MVYVPSLGSVFGINDTIPPIISITSPANNSLLTYSHNLPLIVMTNENSTCTYAVGTGAYTSMGTVFTKSFSSAFSVTENGPQNLTVNCTDIHENSALSQIFFSVNDTTAPIVTRSITSTVNSVRVAFTTNEPANRTVILDGDIRHSSDFTTSHAENFSDLDAGTTYEYSIKACDIVGNCITNSWNARTASDADSSSSGGSSGSGTIPVSTIASQVFTNLGAGQHTMSISSTQIAITQILFTLNTALTGNHLVSVQRIASLPTFIPSNQGTIFQYIRIDKGVISDSNLSSVKISFRIERNWLTSNNMDPENIVLYRYTQQWDALATRRTTSDSTYYYYEADSPGMSYFSIRAYELPPASPSPTPPPAQAPTPPPPTGDLVREVEHPKNLAKKDIGFTWVFIPFYPDRPVCRAWSQFPSLPEEVFQY
jgi:PGF-pre-PGF domain-containing protein